jgi:CP family cyanate transporter-like MFS transporter
VGGVVLVAFNQRLAVASVPPVLGELGLGLTAQSLLVTIPVLCFGLGALAGPWVRRALGEEWAIFLLVAVLMAAIVVRAVLLGWSLFPTTIIIGLSIALLNVLMPSFIKRRFPERPGGMMSAYVASATLGPALAAGLTVPVYEAAGESVTVALGVWALPALVALVVWAPQLRKTSGASAATYGAGRAATGDSGGGREATGGSGARVWRLPLAWQVMVYMGIGSLVFYGPLSWLPQIYQSRGIDPAMAGYLLLVMSFVGMIGSTLSPLIGGRRRDQRSAVMVSAVVTLVGFFGLPVGSDPRYRPGRAIRAGAPDDSGALRGRERRCEAVEHGAVRRVPDRSNGSVRDGYPPHSHRRLVNPHHLLDPCESVRVGDGLPSGLRPGHPRIDGPCALVRETGDGPRSAQLRANVR